MSVFAIHLVTGVATASSKWEQSALPVKAAEETAFKQLLLMHEVVLVARFSKAEECETSPKRRTVLERRAINIILSSGGVEDIWEIVEVMRYWISESSQILTQLGKLREKRGIRSNQQFSASIFMAGRGMCLEWFLELKVLREGSMVSARGLLNQAARFSLPRKYNWMGCSGLLDRDQ